MLRSTRRKVTTLVPIGLVSIIAIMISFNPDLQSQAYSSIQNLTHGTDLQKLPILQEAVSSQQNTVSQQEQSPYGPKQTQYWFDQLRQQPQFMDCTDEQLVHYLNIEKQYDSMTYVHSPLGDWTNNPDAKRYVGDTWMNPNPLSSEEEHWVLEKQNEYGSLMGQVENYHC